MIPAKLAIEETMAAVQAGILITPEQGTIGKGRVFPPCGIYLALACKDAVQLHDRLFAGQAGVAAVNLHDFFSMRPANQFPGVQTDRFLPI